AYDEIDILLCFRDTRPDAPLREEEQQLLLACDRYNIPVATNIATAEVIVMALDQGTLDWREIYNPRSEYNRKRKQAK
ncbi:MAG: methylglyoxal synthase, partial [Clostridia bacterium]|nr:methylglyoxal synthase [Clostridia bacterium]